MIIPFSFSIQQEAAKYLGDGVYRDIPFVEGMQPVATDAAGTFPLLTLRSNNPINLLFVFSRIAPQQDLASSVGSCWRRWHSLS